MHVRVETRRVYVSARGAKLTKRAAYNDAAKALIMAECDCFNGQYCYPGMECDCDKQRCRFCAPCCNARDADAGCDHKESTPYYARVHPRLVRFLKYVDARRAA